MIKVTVKYMCANCKKTHDEEKMFDIWEMMICEGCFGARFFPILEKLGYKIKKDGKVPDRRKN